MVPSQTKGVTTMEKTIGLIGLAVMGANLALNIESRGYKVAVYNRTAAKTDNLKSTEGYGKNFIFTYSPEELIASLPHPRTVILMVKAGKAVDILIESLIPLLDKGDLLIDGGNSLYTDTERREEYLREKGLNYLGLGVSGGEEGARLGPSLMPGGTREGYDMVADVLEKIAARADGEPCVTYIGPGGAGHFVKMVHNGIEYGDMQLIAEVYDLMKHMLGLSNGEMASIFEEWNRGILSSFLIEITARILSREDDQEGRDDLIDLILDKAGQKGTGAWTVAASLDYGIPIPTIAAAVTARGLSSRLRLREQGSSILGKAPLIQIRENRERYIGLLRDALYAAKIISYSQGFDLITSVSEMKDWEIERSEVARIWKAGCIIRAELLGDIVETYKSENEVPHLLMSSRFAGETTERLSALREIVAAGTAHGIPLFAFSSALNYITSLMRVRLPQNLTQAQRDFFGAHTYERTDRKGTFHTEWEPKK